MREGSTEARLAWMTLVRRGHNYWSNLQKRIL